MAESNPRLVLITGGSGLIGGIAAKALSERYRIRVLNRRATAYETVQADITDGDAIRPAFEGVDTVVHLSALLIRVPDRDLLRVNVQGTYNVFEAARLAGVRRVVFASSGAVMSAYHREEPFRSLLDWTHPEIPQVAERLRQARGKPSVRNESSVTTGRLQNDPGDDGQSADTSRPWRVISHRDPPRPAVFYGWTKVAGEELGRHFHEAHGMSVICIRFGAVTQADRPETPGSAAVYMSQRDAAQAVVKSVEAPAFVGFETFYALSDNVARFRDIDHARGVIGFEPQDGILNWPLDSH